MKSELEFKTSNYQFSEADFIEGASGVALL